MRFDMSEEVKYKIVISEGCTAFWTKINDKLIEDLSKEEHEEFIDYLLKKLKEGIYDNTISLDSVIKNFQYSDWEHDSRSCDQCGDTVDKTIWKI